MKPLIQVAVFVVLVFAMPWITAPLLPQQPQTRWELILSYLPGVWAPTVIAVVIIAATRGWRGLGSELAERFSIKAAHVGWLAVALALPASVVAMGWLSARAAGDGRPFVAAGTVAVVALNAVTTGAVGEELGWRGLLLSRLGEIASRCMASIVMAVLWMLWHLPIFLFPDSPYSTWPIVPSLLSIFAFGVVMAGLFHATKGSIVPTILAHLSLNIALGVGGVDLSSEAFWWVLASLFVLVAVGLHRAKAGRDRQGTIAGAG